MGLSHKQFNPRAWTEPWLDLRGNGPHPNFFFKILLYIWVIILVFCFIKLHFYSLNNTIDSFKSIVIVTSFSTAFLQTVKVANSYWLVFGSSLTGFFYLPITTYHISIL